MLKQIHACTSFLRAIHLYSRNPGKGFRRGRVICRLAWSLIGFLCLQPDGRGQSGPPAVPLTPASLPAATTLSSTSSAAVPKPAPADLVLSEPDGVRSQAFSHYAWGCYLQMLQETELAAATTPAVPRALPGVPRRGIAGKAHAVAPVQSLARLPAWLEEYREVLRLDPENREALESFVEPFLRPGQEARLIHELQRLSEIHPASREIHLLLADCEARANRKPDAVLLLQNALRASGWKDPVLLVRLTDMLCDAEQYDAAGQVLDRALGEGGLGDDYLCHLTAGRFYEQRLDAQGEDSGWWRRRSWRRAANAHASKALLLLQSGKLDKVVNARDAIQLMQLLRRLERPQDVEVAGAAAGKVFPEDALRFQIITGATLQALPETEARGVALLEEANRRLEDAFARNARPADATVTPAAAELPGLARLLAWNGELASAYLGMKAKGLPYAIKACERSLAAAPDDWDGRLVLARLYLVDRNAGGDRALAVLAPIPARLQLPIKFFLQSQALEKSGRFSEAVSALAKGAELARRLKDRDFFDSEYYCFRASLLDRQGKTTEALAGAEVALAERPGDPALQNLVGYMLADQDRDLTRAEALIRAALKADPEDPAIQDSLAWVLYRQKRHKDAWTAIQHALELTKDHPDGVILDHAGDIALALGRRDRSREFWEKSLQHDPEKPEATRAKLKALAGP